ncbi:MAG: hypothetical protein AAAFM81_07025 [Pseudomonadota bacterium]
MNNLKTILVILVSVLGLTVVANSTAGQRVAMSYQVQQILSEVDRAVTAGRTNDALSMLAKHERTLYRAGAGAEAASLSCRAHFVASDYAAALAACDSALDKRSNHWSDFNNRGAAKMQLGDVSGAVSDFRKARQLEPGSALVRRNLGNAERALAQ